MTAPVPLPSGWSPSTEVLGDQWAALDPVVAAAALRWSVEVLWKLSGRQFSTTEVTLAPYLSPPGRGWYDRTRRGLLSSVAGGGVQVGGFGGYGDSYADGGFGGFGCGGRNPFVGFRLPGGYVAGVAQVIIDGAVLTEGLDWHLDPDGTLVRVDGQAWPVAQNVYAPRWLVRYTRGLPAPDDANQAAARYALEVARAAVADPRCALPARTRDIVRHGIKTTLVAPETLTDAGLTGVDAVDAWLRAVNPDRLARAATVWAPSSSRHRVVAVHTPDTP